MSIHGKVSTYTQYGCRCDLCRKANTEAVKKYLAKNPDKKPPRTKVPAEEWIPIYNQLKARQFSWMDIERRFGIKAYALRESWKKQRSIHHRTYETLVAGLDEVLTERAAAKKAETDEVKFKANWQDTMRYLFRGGFTKETLAERLDVPVVRLQRFIDSCYKEDRPLAMRIAQLRWIMIQGERRDDDGQSEHERIDSVA